MSFREFFAFNRKSEAQEEQGTEGSMREKLLSDEEENESSTAIEEDKVEGEVEEEK